MMPPFKVTPTTNETVAAPLDERSGVFARFARDERGSTATEYALVVVAIVLYALMIAEIAGLIVVGPGLDRLDDVMSPSPARQGGHQAH